MNRLALSANRLPCFRVSSTRGFACASSSRISLLFLKLVEIHQINDSMKTTHFRTVEELNLDVNAPAVTPTKVQNDKIVRALKKLSFTDQDETSIVKIVSAFVALGIILKPNLLAGWRGG
jgi:hypothetical protein